MQHVVKTQKEVMRPYARLITMLGEQLVKNFNVALIEIIKNAYDADADEVTISLEDFGLKSDVNTLFSDPDSDEIEQKKTSFVVICDNGSGMTEDVIKKHWLNPATPSKREAKESTDDRSKLKKRVLQGEKGIGRFALFKIGKKITITTRPENSDEEYVIIYDFSKYDEDFRKNNGDYLFLDEVKIDFYTQKAVVITPDKKIWKKSHGTEIKIENLKDNNWDKQNIKSIQESIFKMRPIFEIKNKEGLYDFDVEFFINKQKIGYSFNQKQNSILELIENKPVLKILGNFDDVKKMYEFEVNNKHKILSLDSEEIKGLKAYKKEFSSLYKKVDRKLETGPFSFEFYFFDFVADLDKYRVDKESRNIIKENRIYLYRDNIRVAPYGDSTDDWLGIDIFRGTGRAGDMPSNDQIIGRVSISNRTNKNLRDATNREGLLVNTAQQELVFLIKLFLEYIHTKDYERYKNQKKQRRKKNLSTEYGVESRFSELKALVANNPVAVTAVEDIENQFSEERKALAKRLDIVEDLAGVGLSVESASHDMNMMMGRAMNLLDSLINSSNSESNKTIFSFKSDLETLRGEFSFVFDRLKNIQSMFISSKQRTKNVRVKDIFDKIVKIFDSLCKSYGIKIVVEEVGGPLVVKTTDAILMQVLINLFDNSIYWMNSYETKNKIIKVILDSKENKMIVADSGPGIHLDDLPYIFEEFYTGKGVDGRGMGLYIAKRLLERNDFSIYVESKNKIETGANFVIDFNKDDNNEI